MYNRILSEILLKFIRSTNKIINQIYYTNLKFIYFVAKLTSNDNVNLFRNNNKVDNKCLYSERS